MKKRFSALFLALALCPGLAAPAFAADAPAPFTVSVTGPGSETPREDGEFTLRNFTVENLIDGSRFSTMRTVFTRNGETERVKVEEIAALPLGSTVAVDGLRVDEEGGMGPSDVVSLRAWSDPDGDGVYDERLFGYTDFLSTRRDDVRVLPLSEPGPFTYYVIFEGRYGLTVNLAGRDALTSRWYTHRYEDVDVSLPASASLSAEFLTRLFGPNTLIRLGVKSSGTGIEDEEVFFHYLIPAGQLVPPEFTDTPVWCAGEAAWAAEEGITNGYGGSATFAPGVDCTQAQILTFLWRAEKKPIPDAKAPFEVPSSYQDAVNWAYGEGFIDDAFDPNAPCTRAQAVWYIWKALGGKEAGGAAGFSDVDVDAPYARAVSWAVEHGVTKGYGGADTFAPGRVCSRGEVACFLYRAYH